mmetsp:Transcript_15970/g.33260  ORF Transcript_15970/g.33260 Transcript_15970/m.33260 type:complete len:227 (-) Transcript_15970:815-1495(-)
MLHFGTSSGATLGPAGSQRCGRKSTQRAWGRPQLLQPPRLRLQGQSPLPPPPPGSTATLSSSRRRPAHAPMAASAALPSRRAAKHGDGCPPHPIARLRTTKALGWQQRHTWLQPADLSQRLRCRRRRKCSQPEAPQPRSSRSHARSAEPSPCNPYNTSLRNRDLCLCGQRRSGSRFAAIANPAQTSPGPRSLRAVPPAAQLRGILWSRVLQGRPRDRSAQPCQHQS